VAILDHGRIIRQAETEALRRDVKQIVLSRDALVAMRKHLQILDERVDGDRVAVVVEGAERAIEVLGYEGIEHKIVDLNLDEIFEAYVAGKQSDEAAAKPQVELQSLM
jgi:hypothetical protein